MPRRSFASFASFLSFVLASGCAPLEEPAPGPTEPTAPAKRLAVTIEGDIEGLAGRAVTLHLDDALVWSCELHPAPSFFRGPACEAADGWFRGAGLYTFALDDWFATDVFVHDDVVRLELVAETYLHEPGTDGSERRYWGVHVQPYADGNAFATLKTARDDASDRDSVRLQNVSGGMLIKRSMLAALEKWDDDTASWRDVPRAKPSLCGAGWNPFMDADHEQDVYAAFRAHGPQAAGLFRVRYPFRVADEQDEVRLATVVAELSGETFAAREQNPFAFEYD